MKLNKCGKVGVKVGSSLLEACSKDMLHSILSYIEVLCSNRASNYRLASSTGWPFVLFSFLFPASRPWFVGLWWCWQLVVVEQNEEKEEEDETHLSDLTHASLLIYKQLGFYNRSAHFVEYYLMVIQNCRGVVFIDYMWPHVYHICNAIAQNHLSSIC